MSNTTYNDILSNGDNVSLNEAEQISKEFSSKNSLNGSGSNRMLLSFTKSRPNYKDQDIDPDYAIGLLKRVDENMNVYKHLQGILDKILTNRPINPLEIFEEYSQMLKRSYIHKEVHFEHVFVDNINRTECIKSLQMYKCAMIKQTEKHKQYINDKKKSTKKSQIVTSDEDIIVNNSNYVDVQVQNLWDVNYMLNKAGCGLPINEVSLISLTLNEMAQLNKFKNIRFWGKIFGLKKTYFVIECEWSDEELHRKLTLQNNYSKSSPQTEIQKPNVVTHNTAKRSSKLFENKSNKSEMDAEESLQPSSKFNLNFDEDTLNSYMNSSDSMTYSSEDGSYKPKEEIQQKTKLSAETFGIGANRNVYFVTNELDSSYWIELESVRPHHIVEARKIKRYFTGKLYEPINSFPRFDGLEIDYLRAQIARISSSTHICPKGYYIVNRKEISNDMMDVQSTISSESTKKFRFDFILNSRIKLISNTNMINSNYWVHKYPQLDNRGVSNYFDNISSKSLTNVQSTYEGEYDDENYMSYAESVLNDKEELFGNIRNDFINDETPAWKGALCSPFESRYSYIMMTSLIWPGAYAVAYKFKTDLVYIGWAQKQDFSNFSTNLIDELKMKSITYMKNITEYEEVTVEELMRQKAENKMKKKMQHPTREKMIRNYKSNNKS